MNFIEKAKAIQNYYIAGKFEKVINECKIVNKKFPNNSFILNLTGMAFQGLQKFNRSIYFFELAIKADNSNIAAMNNLANSLKQTEQFVRANNIYQEIIKKDPNYLNAYNNYANLKIITNDVEGAIELYKKAIEIANKSKVDPVRFLLHLASAYQSLNKDKEFLLTLKEVLGLDPNNAIAHRILSSFYKYSKENPETMDHISKMNSITDQKNVNMEDKAKIFFALGKAYDDLKIVDKAVKFFLAANHSFSKIIKSNITDEIEIMENIKELFKEVDLNLTHKNFSSKKIIFICGMPRSGTTLTEQIIASHKKVYGAGELSYLNNIITNNFMKKNFFDKKKFLEARNSPTNILNEKFFERLELYNIDKQVITDKAPINFAWIGFIKIFFPNSKIIHCKRNSYDTCLSIYKNFFTSSKMNWTWVQKDISEYYNNYKSLMNFWNTKIPDSIYTIEYEKLVSNNEEEIQNLIKFCELDWDENCLNFHKSAKTPIRTISISQARQPIYNSSVNSSLVYKDYLKEMFDNLK